MTRYLILALWVVAAVDGFFNICPFPTLAGPDPDQCFNKPSEQPVTKADAERLCSQRGMKLPQPQSQGDLVLLTQFFKDNFGVVESVGHAGPGVWMDFERMQPAPTSQGEYETVRRTGTNFQTSDGQVMSQDLWRATQPGDKLDSRDEMCSAVMDITVPFVDDFQCNSESAKHFPICFTSSVNFFDTV